MGLIKLTPAQIIKIHGLLPSSKLLTWEQVCQMRLTPSYLHTQACISKENIRKLQPSAAEWISADLCTLHDCDALSMLPLNPLTMLKVPLDTLFAYSAAKLQSYGVTYAQMVEAGLTPGTMQFFHFSLLDWVSLGLTKHDVHCITEGTCVLLFGMGVQECTRAINELS